MTIRQIPLQPVPSQTLGVVLGVQRCQLAVFQRGANMYLTLTADGANVVTTRICRNRTWLTIGAQYRGFTGDMLFVDLEGSQNPQSAGLGTRFVLLYVPLEDMPQ